MVTLCVDVGVDVAGFRLRLMGPRLREGDGESKANNTGAGLIFNSPIRFSSFQPIPAIPSNPAKDFIPDSSAPARE